MQSSESRGEVMHYGHWGDESAPVKVYEVSAMGERMRARADESVDRKRRDLEQDARMDSSARGLGICTVLACLVIVAYAVVGYLLMRGGHVDALSCAPIWFAGRRMMGARAYEEDHIEEMRSWMYDCAQDDEEMSYVRCLNSDDILRWVDARYDGGIGQFDFSSVGAPVEEGDTSTPTSLLWHGPWWSEWTERNRSVLVDPYTRDREQREAMVECEEARVEESPIYSTPIPICEDTDAEFLMRTYAYDHAPSAYEAFRKDCVYDVIM